MEQNIYIECDCGHNDHIIKFTFAEGDNYDIGSVYTSVQMNHTFPWYHRIWIAIQYVFGHMSKFGHWDCASWDYNTLKKLRTFIDGCITEMEKDSRHTAYDPELVKKFYEEYWMNQDPVRTGNMQ